MNVILCSEKFTNNDVKGNSNRIMDVLRKPYDSKIEFVFFGEAYLNGFDALSWNYSDDITMKEETDKYIALLGEKAKEYNRGLGFGYYEFIDKKVYSSYLIFDNNGVIIQNYRRVSRGWRIKELDTDIYSEGKNIGEFNYNGMHFGVALCGDVWHKELYEEISRMNLDVLVWPVYVNYSAKVWIDVEKEQYIVKSEKLAKNVLYVNSISDEPAYGGTYFQSNALLVEETIPSSKDTYLFVSLKEL